MGEKTFLMGNLNCQVLGTKGRKKLKFGEVSLQVCDIFWRGEKTKKKLFDLSTVLSLNLEILC